MFGKRIFVSEFFLCVCVSQNFCPRIFVQEFCVLVELLSYNWNFVFEKRIFGLIVCNWNFVFGKRIFVPKFCVCVSQNFCPRILCVCLRIFLSEVLSQNYCFFGKRTFFIVTGILKRKVFYMSKVSASSQCIRISGSL